MLHLNVWLRTPYISRACASAIRRKDIQRGSRFRQRSDGSRTIRAASGSDWYVPACFIAVLFDSQEALIGQWRAHTIRRDSKTDPFVYSCIPASNLMQLLAAHDGVKLACSFCNRSRTSRINNPEGDVYEVRDRYEGGCGGSRGRAGRLSGSQAHAGRYRWSEVAGSETAVGCCCR